MAARPGGKLASRPLHFIWMADCSGSMSVNGKIQQLNHAISEALPHMRDVAEQNPNAEVLLRTLAFSNGARWTTPTPTPVADFKWTDLAADHQALTDMGQAFRMVTRELRIPPMTNRSLPPVLILVTDGQPTDDWQKGLTELKAEPWGQRAVRIGIAIGNDADLHVLERFIDHPELKPLTARNSIDLVRFIRWASTAVVQSASAVARASGAAGGSSPGGVPIPTPPSPADSSAGAVVF
jgi:uncharacterized protein YegL